MDSHYRNKLALAIKFMNFKINLVNSWFCLNCRARYLYLEKLSNL